MDASARAIQKSDSVQQKFAFFQAETPVDRLRLVG